MDEAFYGTENKKEMCIWELLRTPGPDSANFRRSLLLWLLNGWSPELQCSISASVFLSLEIVL